MGLHPGKGTNVPLLEGDLCGLNLYHRIQHGCIIVTHLFFRRQYYSNSIVKNYYDYNIRYSEFLEQQFPNCETEHNL